MYESSKKKDHPLTDPNSLVIHSNINKKNKTPIHPSLNLSFIINNKIIRLIYTNLLKYKYFKGPNFKYLFFITLVSELAICNLFSSIFLLEGNWKNKLYTKSQIKT